MVTRTATTRVSRKLKANKGRIMMMARELDRMEKRVERLEKQNVALQAALKKPSQAAPPKIAKLEKQNASLKADLAKLRKKLDENIKETRQNGRHMTEVAGLREPIRAFVKSFKQTPGAPFIEWRMWMMSTFRKQGLFRRQMFR